MTAAMVVVLPVRACACVRAPWHLRWDNTAAVAAAALLVCACLAVPYTIHRPDTQTLTRTDFVCIQIVLMKKEIQYFILQQFVVMIL